MELNKDTVVYFAEDINNLLENFDYNAHAMGCWLEDINIIDRYEAMEYGFVEAIDKIIDSLPEPVPIETLLSTRAAPLLEALEKILPLARDGYKLHINNCSHEEFLQDDIDDLKKATDAITNYKNNL